MLCEAVYASGEMCARFPRELRARCTTLEIGALRTRRFRSYRQRSTVTARKLLSRFSQIALRMCRVQRFRRFARRLNLTRYCLVRATKCRIPSLRERASIHRRKRCRQNAELEILGDRHGRSVGLCRDSFAADLLPKSAPRSKPHSGGVVRASAVTSVVEGTRLFRVHLLVCLVERHNKIL